MKGKTWATLGLIVVMLAGALLLSGCDVNPMDSAVTHLFFMLAATANDVKLQVEPGEEMRGRIIIVGDMQSWGGANSTRPDPDVGVTGPESDQTTGLDEGGNPVAEINELISGVPGAVVEFFTDPETSKEGARFVLPFTSIENLADLANQSLLDGAPPVVAWSQEGSVYTLNFNLDTISAQMTPAGEAKIPFSFAVPGQILDYSPKEGATYDAQNNALLWDLDLGSPTARNIMVRWDDVAPPAAEVQPQPAAPTPALVAAPTVPQPVQPPPLATLAPVLLPTPLPVAPVEANALVVPAPPPAAPQAQSGQSRIAFASNFQGDYEIYTINPDGTDLTRLTTTAGVDWFPAWSPDSSKITYQCNRAERFELCLMNADGTNQLQLTQYGGGAGAVKPVWSPDSAQLAYFAAGQGIHIVNADGSNDRLISPETSWDLMWSPDSTQLVLSQNGTLTIVDSNGGVVRNLIQGVQPSWSRGGRTTVPAAPAPAQIQPEPVIPAPPQPVAPAPAQIQPEPVVPAQPQPIAPAPAQVQPQPQAVAPDVTAGLSGYIAYPVYKPGMTKPTYDIYVSRPDGSDRRLLWEWGRQPDIRRGDGRVVVNGDGQGRDNLWTVNLDGSDAKESSLHPEDSHPRWSPNGDRLLFDSQFYLWNDQRQWTVWLQNSAGKGIEPVSVNVADRVVPGESPIWLDNDWVVYTGCNFWEGAGRCGLYTNPSWGDARARQLTDQADDRAGDFHGDRIAYMSRASGNWDVWTVGFDGGGKVNLSNHPANDGLPTFSPDGGKIAFLSDREGVWAIWVMNADGSSPQKLFDLGGTMGEDWTTERISWGSAG